MNNNHVLQTRPMREDKQIYEKVWSLLPVTAHSKTMGIGNYEFPFSVDLPGGRIYCILHKAFSTDMADIQETIEGLELGSIHYVMQAVVERSKFSANLTTKKNIRILRTVSADSLEMNQTSSVDSTWPDKLEYAISIPTTSFPMGSVLPVNFNLVPLKKGISIDHITCSLKEHQAYTIKHGYYAHIANKEISRTVCSSTITELETEVTQWEIDHSLQIPSSLSECVQDCEAGVFKVSHKVKFVVHIKNPDGHISELRAALPVTILIPPQLFGGQSIPHMDPSDPENQLPSYNSHVYDRFYDGITTPLPSGMNTPAMSRSRRGSMDAADSGDSEATRRALIDGLARLTVMDGRSNPVSVVGSRSGTSTPYSRSNQNSYTPHTPHAMTPHPLNADSLSSSPRGGYFEHRSLPHSPHAFQILDDAVPPISFSAQDLQELNRIPSYGTAAEQTTNPPVSRALPRYHEPAASASVSDSTAVTSSSATPAALARPVAARTASHRQGVLRANHDRLTRPRDT